MTQFFIPQNVINAGWIRNAISSVVKLLNSGDKVVVGAESSSTDAKVVIIGILALENESQDQVFTLSPVLDKLHLDTPAGFVVFTNSVQTAEFAEAFVSVGNLPNAAAIIAATGIDAGFLMSKGLLVAPNATENFDFFGLIEESGLLKLFTRKVGTGIAKNFLLEAGGVELLETVYSGTPTIDFKDTRLKTTFVPVEPEDVVRLLEIALHVSLDSQDGNGRPRVIVSETTTSDYHAVNKKYLEANAISGRKYYKILSEPEGYSVLVNDEVIVVQAGVDIPITLPVADSNLGRQLIIKKIAAGGTTTISAQSGETIDGQVSTTLTDIYSSVTLVAVKYLTQAFWIKI